MNTNICGCVVHAKPGTGTAVAEHLTALPGVEVHAVGEDDKLVVTVEDTADSLAADRLGALNGVTGVINAVLVYHTTAATTWSRCQPPERTSPGSTRHPAQTPEETAVPDTRPISRHDFIKSQAAIAAASVAGVTLPSSLLAKVQDETVDTGIRWDKAPCRFCGTGCSVLVGTRDGKVIASQGDPDAPVNRGLNCIKGYFLPKILYGQDRLTQPLLRKKEGRFAKDGNFEAVSWDEAFDVMAEHWKKALKRSMEENKGKSVDEMTSRVGMFGSGQWTVWEGYAASKLLKAGMRSNAERPRVRALVRCEPAGQQADAGCHRPAVEGDRLQEVRVQGGAGAGCGEPADRTVSRQEPMKHVQRA